MKIILIGNKNDLNEQREISYDEGKNLADDQKIPFFETSAKDNVGINDAIRTITEDIINENKKEKIKEKDQINLEDANNENDNSGYCASCWGKLKKSLIIENYLYKYLKLLY